VKASTKYDKSFDEEKKKSDQPVTGQPKASASKDAPSSNPAGVYIQR
jgi:hypothetical protein